MQNKQRLGRAFEKWASDGKACIQRKWLVFVPVGDAIRGVHRLPNRRALCSATYAQTQSARANEKGPEDWCAGSGKMG
jgi:hypothetical protein